MQDNSGDIARVLHILEAIEQIFEYTLNMDFNNFESNSLVQDACFRKLEVIGEACNAISNDVKDRFASIKWAEIIGLRNVLIHQYFGVDKMIIWNVIRHELIPLKKDMGVILDELKSNN